MIQPKTNAPAAFYNLDGLLDSQFHFGPFRNPNDPYNSDRGINLAPRIGFSYNPDGHAKTVIRGGFSVMSVRSCLRWRGWRPGRRRFHSAW